MDIIMGNQSVGDLDLLQLSPFVIDPEIRYIVVISGFIAYAICILFNLILVLVIIKEKKLHRPMYFILLNQPLNDLLGSSAMIPKVLSDILTETDTVSYPLCFLQGFVVHIYGCATLLNLAALAVDRYIAICKPLRYNTIMSPGTVVLIISVTWCFNVVVISSVFSLQATLPRCRTSLLNIFCDNQTLLRLLCGDKSLINIYGMLAYVLVQSVTVGLQIFSYVRILHACLTTKNPAARTKAINTCIAQLIIAFIFEFTTFVNLSLYRVQNMSLNIQKVNGMLVCLIPPIMNPIVYGLKIKEIRTAMTKMIRNSVSAQ
ncbi:olfactory receptor 24-like [Megalops cyprinoides]|uniref:olfactory receptor 24-like n=1 Tax=Megalops cyprinoides TaxID=118141 RepID=UPI001865062B|nr:olfactory receptor 24-like [Megalops cyprinoides]